MGNSINKDYIICTFRFYPFSSPIVTYTFKCNITNVLEAEIIHWWHNTVKLPKNIEHYNIQITINKINMFNNLCSGFVVLNKTKEIYIIWKMCIKPIISYYNFPPPEYQENPSAPTETK